MTRTPTTRVLRMQVRDADLRVVAPVDRYLEAEIVPKFNPVSLETCGTFTVRVPMEVRDDRGRSRPYRAAAALLQPGAGIVASLDRGRFFSGLVEEPERSRAGSGSAYLTAFGYSDDSLIAARDAWQVPTAAHPDDQGATEYDVRTGTIEAVVKAYVTANAGPGAPDDGRRVPGLAIAPGVSLGPTVTGRARMDNLAQLVTDLCARAGLGWRVLDVGGSLRFEVFQPRDRSRHARFSPALRNVQSYRLATPKATVTRAVVAAGGEGRTRNYDMVTRPAVWHEYREVVVDQRQVDALDDYAVITTTTAALAAVQADITAAPYSDLITFITIVRQGIFNGQHSWAVRAAQITRVITDAEAIETRNSTTRQGMRDLQSDINATVDEVTADEWGNIIDAYAAALDGAGAPLLPALRSALNEAEKDAPNVTTVTDKLTEALTAAQAQDAANDAVAGWIAAPYRPDYATAAQFQWDARVAAANTETQEAGEDAVDEGAARPTFDAPVIDTPAVGFLRPDDAGGYGPLDKVTVGVEGTSFVDVVRQVVVTAAPGRLDIRSIVGVPDQGPNAGLVRRLQAAEKTLAHLTRSR